MITTVIAENGKELHFITKQYSIGLYVSVYEQLGKIPVAQFGSTLSEKEYHKMLRRNTKQRRVSK